jgi:hypothetical protein
VGCESGLRCAVVSGACGLLTALESEYFWLRGDAAAFCAGGREPVEDARLLRVEATWFEVRGAWFGESLSERADDAAL